MSSPTTTAKPTETPAPTATLTPVPITATNTPSPTPTPTNTAFPELTIADVGLPIDPNTTGLFKYIPCYVFTVTRFHAGDGIKFPNSEKTYYIIAPIDGKIVSANFVNESVGYEINVETPYVINGKIVFYDLVHSSGLIENLRVGSVLKKGEPLAIMKNLYGVPSGDPDRGFLLDFALRSGSHKQANASLDGWTGLEYLPFSKYIQDDLAELPSNSFRLMPICSGNPIQQNKPFSTPTPEIQS